MAKKSDKVQNVTVQALKDEQPEEERDEVVEEVGETEVKETAKETEQAKDTAEKGDGDAPEKVNIFVPKTPKVVVQESEVTVVPLYTRRMIRIGRNFYDFVEGQPIRVSRDVERHLRECKMIR